MPIWYRTAAKNGNRSVWSSVHIVKIDTTGPTVPTTGAIGDVSGSNITGSIQTLADGSTDDGAGNITYKYIISTSNETPDKNDSRFSTTVTFTRSCGTSYYAWAIVEDGVGNRSEVKYLGTTSDGVTHVGTRNGTLADYGNTIGLFIVAGGGSDGSMQNGVRQVMAMLELPWYQQINNNIKMIMFTA